MISWRMIGTLDELDDKLEDEFGMLVGLDDKLEDESTG